LQWCSAVPGATREPLQRFDLVHLNQPVEMSQKSITGLSAVPALMGQSRPAQDLPGLWQFDSRIFPGKDMKTIRCAWLLLLVSPLLVAQPVEPKSPERDIVAVVSAAPRSDDAMRGRLCQAAEALHREAGSSDGAADLAERLQARAARLTPDLRGLQALALALRKQIDPAAGPHRKEGHK
jgi:hypothetical protein